MSSGARRMQARVLALVLLLLTGCISRESDGQDPQPGETVAEVANPALRQELLALEQADQAIRAELISRGYENLTPEDVARQDAVDAANLAELQRMVDQHGWPTAALVGRDGVGAAFLILQHADHAWQKRMLPQLRDAVERGELPGEALALLTDRVLVGEGRPQRYGTQAAVVDGVLVVEPIEDEAGVDRRRAELGLPPLEQYRRSLEQAYGLSFADSPEEGTEDPR